MNRRSLFVIISIVYMALHASAVLAANSDVEITPDVCLSQAEEAFSQGNKLSATDTAAAMEQYSKSILYFQKLIDDYGIQNSHVYYNIGNAWMMKGDIGKAILNYRRAKNINNSDTDVAGNLAYARSLRVDQIPVPVEKKVLETLFFWHYDFSLKGRLIAAISFWWITCIIIAIMVKARKFPMPAIAAAVLMLVCTLCLSGSVAYDSMAAERAAFGVITADQTVARQGDSETYPESYAEPLHSGTEFKLLEKRQGWLKVELGNGDTTWVHANDVELI